MTYNQRSKTDTADTVGAAIFGFFDLIFTMVRFATIYLWRNPEVATVLVVALVLSWTPAPGWVCLLVGVLAGTLVFWKFRARLVQRRARLAVRGQVREVLAVQPTWADTTPNVTVTKPKTFQESLESDTKNWRK